MLKNLKIITLSAIILLSTNVFAKGGQVNTLKIDWSVSEDIKYKNIQNEIKETMNGLDEEVVNAYVEYKKEYKEDPTFLTSGIHLSLYGEGNSIKNSWGVYSYVYKYYEFSGGAHGLGGQLIFNYKDEKALNFNSIFKEGYRKFLIDTINKNISKDAKLEDSNPEKKFYYSDVKEITDNQMYFEGDNLVVHFSQYDIAPYSSGAILFKFSKEQLKDYIK